MSMSSLHYALWLKMLAEASSSRPLADVALTIDSMARASYVP
jgi:hypothetical protein